MLRTVFELEGFEVCWARDGREGLQMAQVFAPDVILTDLMMPVLDGFGFMREYLLASGGRPAPILAYSASLAYLRLAESNGASAIISKPFEIDYLISSVQRLLRLGPKGPGVPDPAAAVLGSAALDERKRIEAVLRLSLDAPSRNGVLDQLVYRAARIFDVPICAVSLVKESVQRMHAVCGIDRPAALEHPRESAFCNYVVAAHSTLVVQDMSIDPLFSENPLVRERGLRFYAGVPLVTRSGDAVGTLCLMDFRTREFSHADVKLLKILAKRVMAEFERRESREHPDEPVSNYQFLGLIDEETGIVGREGFLDLLEVQTLRMLESRKGLALVVASLPAERLVDSLKAILERFPDAWAGRLGRNRLAIAVPGYAHLAARQVVEGLGLPIEKLASLDACMFLGSVPLALSQLEHLLEAAPALKRAG